MRDMWPAIAWDGGARIAFAVRGALKDSVITLLAHGPSASVCAAVWEAAAGLCVVPMPEHTQHLDLIATAPDGDREIIAIELDGQLSPSMTDLTQEGLRWALLHGIGGVLTVSDEEPIVGRTCLNLWAISPAGRRIKVGPLIDVELDETVTKVATASSTDGIFIELARHGGASPVLAAHIPVDPERLRGAPTDATGAGGPDAARRGFRMIAADPEATPGVIAVTDWRTGDRLVLYAPRTHRIAFADAPRPGTRLVLTCLEAGAVTASLATYAYRPATSSALAALSGEETTGGGWRAGGDAADDAAVLAEAWWKRTRPPEEPHTTALETSVRTPAAAHPLARLTASSFGRTDSGVSPLMAAVSTALGLPPALVEELEALPATDRAAFAQWAALAPATAGDAARLRIILPDLSARPADPRAAELIRIAADPELPPRMAGLANRIAPQARTAEQREEVEKLRRLGDAQRADWAPLAIVAAGLALFERHPPPPSEASPVGRILAGLKSDAAVWEEARREGETADSAAVDQKRELIRTAAADAGLPEEVRTDIAAQLPGLAAPEIGLLHRHLESAVRRRELVGAVKQAVLVLDAAAGADGLSARMDRSGDPIMGMTRIGSAAEPAVRALVAAPQARDALVALTAWINSCVARADGGHPAGDQLVRHLKSYGCFLLLNAISDECRTRLAGQGDSAAALVSRLTSGLVETLPRLAAAASAAAGEDIRLGLSFTDKLPALEGKASS